MIEQWQELKETITEMRDNDGTVTQQEVCKFLANYMEILEKQMPQPCEDCVSRDEVITQIFYSTDNSGDVVLGKELRDRIKRLPSVTPIEKIAKWIEMYESEEWYGSLIECSECGFEMIDIEEANYCPNCGAKMDGGGWNIS